MRFTTIVTVRDRRRGAARGEVAGRGLAIAGNLGLCVLEVDGADVGTSDPEPTLPVARAGVSQAVVDHVKGGDGALAVIDAHGGGPAGDPLFDTAAERILQRCPQPVLVLGPRADVLLPTRTLVVPSDGAGLVTAAIDAVQAWIECFGAADVTVLALGAADSWPTADDAPPADDAQRAVNTLAAGGIPAQLVRSADTEPAAAIVAACPDQAGTVVVLAAPRWPSTPTHWFSTARRLIRNGGHPVLLVPADLPSRERSRVGTNGPGGRSGDGED